jgi:ribose 5-phosphate isomerase A
MAEITAKHRAAHQAASEVRSGMRLGLGSGTTVNLVAAALGERERRGELHDLKVVVASRWTDAAAREAGLTVVDLNDYPQLDLAIDGADEIDPRRNMIKGGGGALLRERIVLSAARERLIAADESKLVETLGETWALPVEVVQFGWRVAESALQTVGLNPTLRLDGGAPFVTDEGNYIFDCRCGPITDEAALLEVLRAVPGLMDHGLFIGLASRVLIGTADGVREM